MATTKEIANMTFKMAPGKDLTTAKNDLQMFNILMSMDGIRSVGTIAKQDSYDLNVLAVKVSQMVKIGLLVPVRDASGGSSVGTETIKALQSELTKLVGPAAGMLLDDSARKLGHNLDAFPIGKANELLDMVSKFIQDHRKAVEFKNRMMALIN